MTATEKMDERRKDPRARAEFAQQAAKLWGVFCTMPLDALPQMLQRVVAALVRRRWRALASLEANTAKLRDRR